MNGKNTSGTKATEKVDGHLCTPQKNTRGVYHYSNIPAYISMDF